jgi:hypothetical protein
LLAFANKEITHEAILISMKSFDQVVDWHISSLSHGPMNNTVCPKRLKLTQSLTSLSIYLQLNRYDISYFQITHIAAGEEGEPVGKLPKRIGGETFDKKVALAKIGHPMVSLIWFENIELHMEINISRRSFMAFANGNLYIVWLAASSTVEKALHRSPSQAVDVFAPRNRFFVRVWRHRTGFCDRHSKQVLGNERKEGSIGRNRNYKGIYETDFW